MKEFLKRSRVGFTLIEILIAIVILSALTATWMLSPGDSILSAKVDRIIYNMMMIKDAVLLYLSYEPDKPTIADFKNNITKYLGDIANSNVKFPNDKTIISSDEYRYELYNDASNHVVCWRVQYVFAGDPDRDKIKPKLEKLAPSLKLLYKNVGTPYKAATDTEYKVVLRIN